MKITGKNRALIVSLEGLDGCGKTTQIPLLANAFRDAGFIVGTIRDPGGTPICDKIREILKHHDPNVEPLDSKAELMLFLASRAQMVSRVLIPSIPECDLILLDRFVDSTMVYQGWINKVLPLEPLWELCKISCYNIIPDITILLDLLPSASKARRAKGLTTKPDKYDDKDTEFHQQLYRAYHNNVVFMDTQERTMLTIPAEDAVERVTQMLITLINPELRERRYVREAKLAGSDCK
jgi:dTMP kinase